MAEWALRVHGRRHIIKTNLTLYNNNVESVLLYGWQEVKGNITKIDAFHYS